MPLDGKGHPLCRHQPPERCTRWWCTYKRMLLLAAVALLLVGLLAWGDATVHPEWLPWNRG